MRDFGVYPESTSKLLNYFSWDLQKEQKSWRENSGTSNCMRAVSVRMVAIETERDGHI